MLLERGREFSPCVSRGRVALSVIVLVACAIAAAPAPRVIAFAQARPAFTVASIRPSDPANHVWRASITGARYTASNMRLLDLIERAYRVKPFQISGEPAWAGTDRFDIRAEADNEIRDDALSGMLQTLLADRFNSPSTVLRRSNRFLRWWWGKAVRKCGGRRTRMRASPQRASIPVA